VKVGITEKQISADEKTQHLETSVQIATAGSCFHSASKSGI